LIHNPNAFDAPVMVSSHLKGHHRKWRGTFSIALSNTALAPLLSKIRNMDPVTY